MKTINKVLILLVATIRIYSCENPTSDQTVPPPDLSAEKKIFDSEEQKEPKEVDFKSLPLQKLDEELQQELKNPTPSDVSFEVKLNVLKNLVQYEKHIKDVYAHVQNNTVAGQVARELMVQDGPKFLREEIDEEKLKKVYNWDDDNVEHLNDLLGSIKSLYHNITVDVKEKPSPFEIFFSKQQNNYI